MMSNEAAQDEVTLDDEFEEQIEVTESPEETATPDTTASGEETQEIEIDEKQKALNKLAFEKREANRKLKEAEKRLEELEAKQSQAPAQTALPKMPIEADFDYDTDKYQEALSKYHADMVRYEVNQVITQTRTQEAAAVKQRQRKETQEKFNQQIMEANIPDYVDSVSQLPIFDPTVTDAIMAAENGVKVAYYLSQHLDQADVIAASDPIVAAMRIGEISARLKQATTKPKTSAAPSPIEPLKQGGAAIGEVESELIAGATFE